MAGKKIVFYLRLSVILFISLSVEVHAQGEPRCKNWSARLESTQGKVQWRPSTTSTWQIASVGDYFCAGDNVRVDTHRATLKLANDTLVRLNEGAFIKFSPTRKSFGLRLLEGAAYFISRTPKVFSVELPFVNAAIEGTEFLVEHREKSSTSRAVDHILVFEGRVTGKNDKGATSILAGQKITVHQEQAPSKISTLSLAESADWILYFPPLIFIDDTISNQISTLLTAAKYREALELIKNSSGASVTQHTVQAALELYFGRLHDARLSINKIRSKRPANAEALNAMIALNQGQIAQAHAIAKRLIKESPSSMTYLTLSYTRQAQAKLQLALEAARQAAASAPTQALIWLRVAELALSVGQISEARQAVANAEALSPTLPRTHLIKGYVALNELKYRQAFKEFSQATQLDPTDPLAKFSLGLSTIRQGQLTSGRELIENAVILDPSNSLFRSYLGKSYSHEGRDNVAATQYALAQTLDPEDPTPWLYQALSLQNQKRYIDAHKALTQSIVRNDNRASYRSRQQLDADMAVRNANLAEIYRTLGFTGQGKMLAARSLESQPSNYAAHKLLAESLIENTRQDIAASSEILQAQIRQPLSANPLRSILSEQDLIVASGYAPSQLGLNEYSPLFNSEKPKVQLALAGGEDDTRVVDAFISKLNNRTAFAVEHYHYETKGFEADYNREYRVSNVYLQSQISPNIKALVERRKREDERGLLASNISLTNTENFISETDTTRIAIQYTPSPGAELLMVLDSIDDFSEKASSTFLPDPVFDPENIIKSETKDKIFDGELQSILTFDKVNITSGLIKSKIDREQLRSVQLIGVPVVFDPTITTSKGDIKYESLYSYINTNVNHKLNLSAGIAYIDFEDISKEDEKLWNTRLGVRYSINDKIDIQVAHFKDFKKPLEINQSLEPTHIQGINLLYDDVNLMKSNNAALAVDAKLSSYLHLQSEIVNRILDASLVESAEDNEIKETRFNTNLHFLSSRYSFLANLNIERQKFTKGSKPSNLPLDLDTASLSGTFNYFFNTSLTSSIKLSIIDQKSRFLQDEEQALEQREKFELLDASLNYAPANSPFSMSVEGKNLTNRDFRYQDTNILDGSVRSLSFIPERTALLRLNISI